MTPKREREERKYTERNDRDGKKIYEGDCIQGKSIEGNIENYTVKWSEYRSCWIGENPNDMYDISQEIFNQFKVIETAEQERCSICGDLVSSSTVHIHMDNAAKQQAQAREIQERAEARKALATFKNVVSRSTTVFVAQDENENGIVIPKEILLSLVKGCGDSLDREEQLTDVVAEQDKEIQRLRQIEEDYKALQHIMERARRLAFQAAEEEGV